MSEKILKSACRCLVFFDLLVLSNSAESKCACSVLRLSLLVLIVYLSLHRRSVLGKRILQSAAASIMTMSLSPPASKNQKKQNSMGSSGSASPTPQLSAKMAKNSKLGVFKRPLEDVCRIRPSPDGRVEIPYILSSGIRWI